MIKIHREGRKPLFIALAVFTVLYLGLYYLISIEWIVNLVLIAFLVLYVFMINFFRNPARHVHIDDNHVVAPADGKIVAIEEVEETEYFNDKRIQISIFMSPLNVHVNRYPISGKISYAKYHPGAFLVAWHPKSSFLNERT